MEGYVAQANEFANHHSNKLSASSSLSSTCFLQPPAPQLIPIQLTENNYILWKSLFIPVLKAYNMLDHAQGKTHCPPQFLTTIDDNEDKKESRRENPAYNIWMQRDQMFLTWINASLSLKLLRYTKDCTSGQALWHHLEDVFSKSAQAHVLALKARLKTLKLHVRDKPETYIGKARNIANELEAAGCPINDRELNCYILEGLPEFYEDVASLIRNKSHPVTEKELHDLLVSHKTRKNAEALVPSFKSRLEKLKYDGDRCDQMSRYLIEAREISDGLRAGGSPLKDGELTRHILEGLPKCYHKLVDSIKNRPHPITQEELQKLLLSHPYIPNLCDRIYVHICCDRCFCVGQNRSPTRCALA